MRAAIAALLLCALAGAARAIAPQVAGPEIIDHGRFEKVRLYQPVGAPSGVVLFLSGDSGWQRQEDLQAQALVAEGAFVIGIDSVQFMQVLEADGGECGFPDGDLDNLSRFVQAYARLPGYRPAILAGYSAGATLAYATLAQAPTDAFAAGLVTGFCPDLDLAKPLCPGDGLAFKARPPVAGQVKAVDFLPRRDLAVPFAALLGAKDPICDAAATQRFIDAMPAARQKLLQGVGHDYGDDGRARAALAAAYRKLAAAQGQVAVAPNDLGDLPVIEEPADAGAGTPATAPYLAMFWSGDGGWAGIDKAVSDALNARGIPVVGVDSLRYFWTKRTPEGIAADIEHIAHHYLKSLGKQKLILIGYSQGADVLPFAVNRLAPGLKKKLALVATMGLSDHAVFEFELGNWVSDNNDGPETLPEVRKLGALRFLCIHGEEDDDSICPRLAGSGAQVVELKGGHHFDGNYEGLADAILKALPGR